MPHAPVDFRDHVAKKAAIGFALELVGNEKRHVRHGVGQVNQQRSVPVLFDELHRPLGIPRGQVPLVLRGDVRIDGLFFFNQRQRGEVLSGGMRRPHVVGIGQPEIVVEPVPRGKELGMVAEVPLAVDRRGVAALLDEFRKGHLVGVDTVPRAGAQGPQNPDAIRITAGD